MTSGGGADSTETPNTVLMHERETDKLPVAKKQKQEDGTHPGEEIKPKKSFKAVANLVLAMKRFQCMQLTIYR